MTEKSRQKFKYPENQLSFWGEIKSIFHERRNSFICQNFFQTWACAINYVLFFIFAQLQKWSFIYYVHKIFRKTNISHPLIRTQTFFKCNKWMISKYIFCSLNKGRSGLCNKKLSYSCLLQNLRNIFGRNDHNKFCSHNASLPCCENVR